MTNLKPAHAVCLPYCTIGYLETGYHTLVCVLEHLLNLRTYSWLKPNVLWVLLSSQSSVRPSADLSSLIYSQAELQDAQSQHGFPVVSEEGNYLRPLLTVEHAIGRNCSAKSIHATANKLLFSPTLSTRRGSSRSLRR
jgi:hypothetical protein